MDYNKMITELQSEYKGISISFKENKVCISYKDMEFEFDTNESLVSDFNKKINKIKIEISKKERQKENIDKYNFIIENMRKNKPIKAKDIKSIDDMLRYIKRKVLKNGLKEYKRLGYGCSTSIDLYGHLIKELGHSFIYSNSDIDKYISAMESNGFLTYYNSDDYQIEIRDLEVLFNTNDWIDCFNILRKGDIKSQRVMLPYGRIVYESALKRPSVYCYVDEEYLNLYKSENVTFLPTKDEKIKQMIEVA